MEEYTLSNVYFEQFHQKTGILLISALGNGGMGVVYKGLDKKNRPVAVKMLRTDVESADTTVSDSTVQRFHRECLVMKTLVHPNIVPVLDVIEYNTALEDQKYLVLPFYKNGTLCSVLKKMKDKREEYVVEKMAEICDGLAYLHGMNIVHRDVKLANIFIDDNGRALLGDFGLVTDKQSSLTGVDDVLGTAYYMAPEQLNPPYDEDNEKDNEHYKVKSQPSWDIYAVGVCLFNALHCKNEVYTFNENSLGVFPYMGKDVESIIWNICEGKKRKKLNLHSGVKNGLEKIVEKFLERNPKNRVKPEEANEKLRNWRAPKKKSFVSRIFGW